MRTARFYQLQESKDAAAEANRRIKKLGIDRPPMAETQNPYGYVSTPLDGIWLRAPYLHNGSVPTLHDLLNPPNERPQTFHRGHDVFDPVKIGFKEPPPQPTGPNGTLTQPYFLCDTREKGNGNQSTPTAPSYPARTKRNCWNI